MTTESVIPDRPLTIDDIINAMPDGWKNNPRIFSADQARLRNGAVVMVVEISEQSVLFLMFVSEKNISQRESFILSKNSFTSQEAVESLCKITPLVDTWNTLVREEKEKTGGEYDPFPELMTSTKTAGFSVIAVSDRSRFHFRNPHNHLAGEIANAGNNLCQMTLNGISHDDVKKIIALLADHP